MLFFWFVFPILVSTTCNCIEQALWNLNSKIEISEAKLSEAKRKLDIYSASEAVFKSEIKMLKHCYDGLIVQKNFLETELHNTMIFDPGYSIKYAATEINKNKIDVNQEEFFKCVKELKLIEMVFSALSVTIKEDVKNIEQLKSLMACF